MKWDCRGTIAVGRATMLLRKRFLPLYAAAAMLLAAGCTPRQFEDPIPAMTSKLNAASVQLRAAEQAARQMPDDPRRIEALHEMLWSRGYTGEVRKYAIDELIKHDEADFREKLARRIVLIFNYETLKYILALAEQRRWDDFTPVAVRSWARPVHGIKDDDRPEKRVIETLNPDKPIERVIFEVFADADDEATIAEQVGAWTLLCRIGETESLIGYLENAPETTALVIDLKAAARDLHTLPNNREGVLWLQSLRDASYAQWWSAAKARVAQLDSKQRLGLALRHMPVLLALDEQTLSLDRSALLERIRRRLDRAEHHFKGPTYDAPMSDWPQRLSEAESQLVWADLAAIHLMLEAIEDQALVSELFAQADEDEADRTTEYGGVISHDAGRFVAHLYEPMIRRSDYRFIPSQAMVEHMYTSIAHYHFHAHDHSNSEHSGPGRGDLRLADNLQPNGLVFTFIDRNRLNVDYYQPGGTVVDLGTIYRTGR